MLKPPLILGIVLLAAACSDGDGDLVGPGTGSLDISVVTTGQSTAPGYTVSLDGGSAVAIDLNGSVHHDGVSAGQHTVVLAALPQGCTVAGDNPRSVAVEPAGTTSVTFAVTCAPMTGRIDVVTQTSGAGPATYTLMVDGAAMGTVAAAATRTLEGVTVGGHTIGLSEVPANCQLQGDNPQSVTVEETAAAVVTFTLTCAAPPAETGSLKVTTATSGSNPDADGYQVAIAGAQPQPVAASGSVTVTGLGAGGHAVQLSAVAPNCSVAGDNPRTVTVVAGATVDVNFAVTCAAVPGTGTTGSIRISTATSGSSPDPDGYTYKLDDRAPAAIGVSAAVTVAELAAGNHSILIEGVASNCTLAGDNPRSVTVAAGAIVEAAFAVTCAAVPGTGTTGSIRISTATTGLSPDPDGYTYKLDDRAAASIGASASVTVADVAAGNHSILIEGVASNCTLAGANPRSVSVTAGSTAEAAFTVTCESSNAQNWTKMTSNTTEDLWGVWAGSRSDAFAVSRTSIFHFDGSSWSSQALTPPGAAVAAIWGSSSTDVFAVGSGNSDAFRTGVILHYNGTAWTPMEPPPSGNDMKDAFYSSVWGSSGRDVYSVGVFTDGFFTDALVAHFDGTGWTRVTVPHSGGRQLRDVFGTSPSDVWAGGITVLPSDVGPAVGFVYHYNGSEWTYTVVAEEFSILGIWASSPADAFAVGWMGGSGVVFHWNGAAWTRMTVPAGTGTLADVWGSSATDVYAAGENGILHYDGTAWSVVATAGLLNDIWGASANDIFAVGGNGGIYHGPR